MSGKQYFDPLDIGLQDSLALGLISPSRCSIGFERPDGLALRIYMLSDTMYVHGFVVRCSLEERVPSFANCISF